MEYDFKDEELLQIADFCCDGCLTLDILESVDNIRKYESIEVYAKSELIEEIVKKIIMADESFTFGAVTFANGIADSEYGDVYCLSINDLNEIWIEPVYRFNEKDKEWKLYDSEAILAYVYEEDCKQDLIDKLEKCDVPTLLFGFEKE